MKPIGKFLGFKGMGGLLEFSDKSYKEKGDLCLRPKDISYSIQTYLITKLTIETGYSVAPCGNRVESDQVCHSVVLLSQRR